MGVQAAHVYGNLLVVFRLDLFFCETSGLPRSKLSLLDLVGLFGGVSGWGGSRHILMAGIYFDLFWDVFRVEWPLFFVVFVFRFVAKSSTTIFEVSKCSPFCVVGFFG